mmetsp:Transcript_67711/g.181084  ORF Transcript_67711/g.181084 Transcript_67711/m.181084 type:complete len:313 (+) Transcript_67711:697-1635(+)
MSAITTGTYSMGYLPLAQLHPTWSSVSSSVVAVGMRLRPPLASVCSGASLVARRDGLYRQEGCCGFGRSRKKPSYSKPLSGRAVKGGAAVEGGGMEERLGGGRGMALGCPRGGDNGAPPPGGGGPQAAPAGPGLLHGVDCGEVISAISRSLWRNRAENTWLSPSRSPTQHQSRCSSSARVLALRILSREWSAGSVGDENSRSWCLECSGWTLSKPQTARKKVSSFRILPLKSIIIVSGPAYPASSNKSFSAFTVACLDFTLDTHSHPSIKILTAGSCGIARIVEFLVLALSPPLIWGFCEKVLATTPIWTNV